MEYAIHVPKMLSFLGYHDFNAYIPGIQNILDGYTSQEGITYPSLEQRMANGRTAIDALKTYKQAVKDENHPLADSTLQVFKANYSDFGYGYLSSPYDVILTCHSYSSVSESWSAWVCYSHFYSFFPCGMQRRENSRNSNSFLTWLLSAFPWLTSLPNAVGSWLKLVANLGSYRI